jgi:hypothetical protein
MIKKIFLGIIVGITLVSTGAWFGRHTIARFAQQAMLPKAIPYKEVTLPSTTPRQIKTTPVAPSVLPTLPTNNTLPVEANLAVPFTPQAPHANWEDPYGEFCEEASVLMAIRYLQNKKIPSATVADAALLAIQDFEEKRFGYYKDTNAEETATIFREHFSYTNVEVKQNPTINNIKQAIAVGRVVLVPVAGREIGNPYFQTPGPLYHMLVIKGYTSDGKFITNDPGTKRGADFLYNEEVLMNAIHDWRDDGNINLGKKVVIIAG